MATDDEPMAVLKWEFFSKAFPGLLVKGSHEMRTVSEAKKLAERLNADFGEGTHFVEVLNQTHDEREPLF